MNEIIGSFSTKGKIGIGLPLGNLTSQLLINVYMNEFDQFVMRDLHVKYYIRYADDFVILSEDKTKLESSLTKISEYLSNKLKLELHPGKVQIKTLSSGVDFLGWIHFSDHRVLRRATRQRMIRRIAGYPTDEIHQSYLGLLKHGNANKIRRKFLVAHSCR